MAANHELELKLELEPGAGARLARALEARFGAGDTRSLVSTYFDTPDLKLRENAVSLRVRRSGRRGLQTIKAGSMRHGGLFDRREWECELEGPDPDLAAAADTPLGPLLKHGDVREALAPILETRVERTLWTVTEGVDGASGEIELALDRGLVEAEGRHADLCELELELKSGSPWALLSLARSLASEVQDAGLRLGVRSKSDRGYSLLEKTDRRAIQAEPVELKPDMTAGAAFQAIARGCIRHFRLNEPLVIETGEAEALHQARVALRRLRSALNLFKPLLLGPEAEPLKARLKDLTQALGDVRDHDVFLADLSRPAGPEGDDERRKALAEQVRREREEAWRGVVERLATPEARSLMLDVSVWVEAGEWTVAEAVQTAREQPISTFAIDVLERRRRKLRRDSAHLARLDREGRHQVRIDAKKLRYAVEFLADVAVHRGAYKRYRAFLAALKALQTDLGELNDMAQTQAMAAQLARRFAERKGGVRANAELVFAAGREAGRVEAKVGPGLETAAETCRRFRDAKPFWRA
jgi:inorganic triphosphatase YgiF